MPDGGYMRPVLKETYLRKAGVTRQMPAAKPKIRKLYKPSYKGKGVV